MVAFKSVCVVGLVLVDLIVFSESMKLGEPGVCTAKVGKSVRQSSRRCRGRKCLVPHERSPTPICCEGWDHDATRDVCKPVCEGGCSIGECRLPNQCQCPQGYQQDNHCLPECNPPCENGTCSSPGVCECNEGYIKINPNQCTPKCENCQHGDCIAPNDCSCHEGYTKEDGICTPQCNSTCNNGFCSGPNKCSCHIGYKNENDLNCVPECEKECTNAACVAPNNCSCLTGYESVDEWSCKPVCNNCEHGKCVAPNTCNCDAGYDKPTNTSSDECQPVCSTPCVNSSCSSPGSCSCWAGYEKVSSYACKPKCLACEFGECVDPEICRCNAGYEMLEGICQPICSKSCVNGNCSAPDTCSCQEGYEKNETDRSVCYKPCEVCTFGRCSLHGECVCDSGLDSNGTCKALDCNMCTSNCTEGVCLCEDGRQCEFNIDQPAGVASSQNLAGLELTWILGGSIALLLIILVMVVLQRIYHRRREYDGKAAGNDAPFGSVVYTLPHTLVSNSPDDEAPDTYEEGLKTTHDPEESIHRLLERYEESERV